MRKRKPESTAKKSTAPRYLKKEVYDEDQIAKSTLIYIDAGGFKIEDKSQECLEAENQECFTYYVEEERGEGSIDGFNVEIETTAEENTFNDFETEEAVQRPIAAEVSVSEHSFSDNPVKKTAKRVRTIKRKRIYWQRAEPLFIDTWARYDKYLELNSKRNVEVYRDMQRNLSKHGIDLTTSEIKFKIRNLRLKYEKLIADGTELTWPLFQKVSDIILKVNRGNDSAKDLQDYDVHNESSIASSPLNNLGKSPHQASLNLAKKTIKLKPSKISETSTSLPPSLKASVAQFDETSTSTPKAPMAQFADNLGDTFADLSKNSSQQIHQSLLSMNESLTEFMRMDRERLEHEKQVLEVMKSIADDTKRMTNAITKFLNNYEV